MLNEENQNVPLACVMFGGSPHIGNEQFFRVAGYFAGYAINTLMDDYLTFIQKNGSKIFSDEDIALLSEKNSFEDEDFCNTMNKIMEHEGEFDDHEFMRCYMFAMAAQNIISEFEGIREGDGIQFES